MTTQPPSHEEVQQHCDHGNVVGQYCYECASAFARTPAAQLPELTKWLREEANANDKSGAGFDPIVIKWVDKLRGWAAVLESIQVEQLRDWNTIHGLLVERDQLRARIGELEKENERVRNSRLRIIDECGTYNKQQSERIAALEKDAERARKYDELIYAVEKKFPNESRHETALRYIREREMPNNDQRAARLDASGGSSPPEDQP